MGGWNSSGCSDYDSEEEETAAPVHNSELDAAYKKTVEKIKPQIEECLKMAKQGYAEAVRLAEAHGIPFETQVLNRRHTYLPTLPTGVDAEVIEQTTGVWTNSESSGVGWQNSSSNC